MKNQKLDSYYFQNFQNYSDHAIGFADSQTSMDLYQYLDANSMLQILGMNMSLPLNIPMMFWLRKEIYRGEIGNVDIPMFIFSKF